MGEIKRLENPAKFLLDSGLLFELNRTIFHPFGLALEVIIDDETGEVIGFGGIWDYREDPEGMLYGEEELKSGFKKFYKFMNEFGFEKMKERIDAIGYLFQYNDSKEVKQIQFKFDDLHELEEGYKRR